MIPDSAFGRFVYVVLLGGLAFAAAAEGPAMLVVMMPLAALIILTVWRNVLIGLGLIGGTDESAASTGAATPTEQQGGGKMTGVIGLIIIAVILAMSRGLGDVIEQWLRDNF
ncbi:hypothetical protein [Maioricimonas rarisocia]|uniref:hypothetical protein n=1 Tax=Maioricimonas rarisocia TaxID=2528026 RepID=UPI001E2E9C79|nr:hypothetical protein [Maioricimonas rarisocia]